MQRNSKTQFPPADARPASVLACTIGALLILFMASVGAKPQEVASVSPDSGWERPLEQCWTFSSSNMSRLDVASDNAGNIALPQTPAELILISALTGTRISTVELGGRLIASPTIVGEFLYAVSGSESEGKIQTRIHRIDLESGISIAGKPVEFEAGSLLSVFEDKAAAVSPDGRIHYFSRDGKTQSRSSLLTRASGSVVFGRKLAIWDSEGRFVLEDLSENGVQIRFDLGSPASGAFFLAEKAVYAGTMDGFVVALDPESKEVEWRSRTGGSIDSIQEIEDDLLVTSRDNFVYRLSSYDGARVWKRKLAGRIVGITRLDGRHLALASLGSNEIAIIRSDDGKLVNSVAVEGARYLVSAPVIVNGLLVAAHDGGLSAFGKKSTCGKN